MFTGLVQQIGTIRRVERLAEGARLHLEASFPALVLGESIATDGVCLTVTRATRGGYTVDASSETLARSTLDLAAAGQRVHLERADAVGDRLGGHLLTGHVDGVGRLRTCRPVGSALALVFETPPSLAPFLAPKGSIAVDGVSLTINAAANDTFEVMIVPFTQGETRLPSLRPGDRVNLEVDVLAKYVARLLGRPGVDGEGGQGEGLSLDVLREHGYV